MEHRREIDGLRAVAVIPVIFFHAGQSLFAGGFLGVDVFFVISGYLITSLLIEDSRRGDVSLRRFYERRVRRIVPMLYLVMALCAFGGWFLMLPDQLENLGQSMVATTLLSNNLLLAATTGYWDVSIALKPLVHSWSLGVEEQFYLLLPGLFLLVRRPAARRAWLAGVAVAGLLRQHGGFARLQAWQQRPNILTRAGQHSLVFYLVHQPVLIGLVYLATLVFPPPAPDPIADYNRSCQATCTAGGNDAGLCQRFCACTADRLVSQSLFQPMQRGEIDPTTDQRVLDIAGQCTAVSMENQQ